TPRDDLRAPNLSAFGRAVSGTGAGGGCLETPDPDFQQASSVCILAADSLFGDFVVSAESGLAGRDFSVVGQYTKISRQFSVLEQPGNGVYQRRANCSGGKSLPTGSGKPARLSAGTGQ